MVLIEIEELPDTERRMERDHKDLLDYLKQFMNMNTKYAWIVYEPNEYSSSISAHSTISRACCRYNLPIKACLRNNDLYFVRTDM